MAVCTKTELQIPSRFGCEKIAMDFVASVAKRTGFDHAQIEDLKTAVSEACLNAMEHGNEMDTSKAVGITLTVEDSGIQVEIHDEGQGIGQVHPPRIEEQIEGKHKPRGWGIFLIRNLMNKVEFETRPEGGNVVRMILYLQKKEDAAR